MADSAPRDERAVPPDWEAFDRYARPLLLMKFAYAAREGLDPEHVVQDTLVRAHQHFEQLDSYRAMLAWCRQDGTWAILGAAKAGFTRWERPHGEFGELPAPHLTVEGPERATVERLAVDEVLARLSPEDREVLLLDSEDFSDEQIARRLNVSPSTARSRLRRARRRFKLAAGGSAPALPAWRLRRWITEWQPAVAAGNGVPATAAASVALTLLAVVGTPPLPFVRSDEPRVPAAAPIGPGRAHGTVAAPRPTVDAPSPHGVNAQDTPHGRGDAGAAAPPTVTPPVGSPLPHCVGVCSVPGHPAPPDGWRGDRIRVKPLGDDSPGVEQAVTPACHHVPDNPAVECEPGKDPDEFVVKELPPQPDPGGTP